MGKEKEIYIIRHGETAYNRKNVVQGKGINSSLNDTGRQQAMRFFEAYRHLNFDSIFTSTLLRTQQTILPFIINGYPYERHSGLDEISWGKYEGKTEALQQTGGFQTVVERWKNGETDYEMEEGESPLTVQLRQQQFLGDVIEPHPGQRLLICTHGRALRILACTLLNIPLSKMDTFHHQNLSLYIFRYDGRKYNLIRENEISHLQD